MKNYTPGPWSRNIRPVSKYPIVFAGRNTHVARVIADGLSESEAEANANLIAAAPDLLEALHMMLVQFTKTPSTLKDSEARAKAHAAIAKATGEQA